MTHTGPDLDEFIKMAMRGSGSVRVPEVKSRFETVAERPSGLVNLDISSICNLKCDMCILWNEKNAGRVLKKTIDYDLLIKIIDEIAVYCPGAVVSLTPRGELFCHPRAMDIIREIKRRGLRVCFVTNGTLIGKDEIQSFIDLKVDEVRFSIDGLLPETYRKIRGVDKLGTVAENVWELARLLRGGAVVGVPKIIINFVLQNLNAAEMVPFLVHWAPIVTHVQVNKWDTDTVSPFSIKNLNREFPLPERYVCTEPWRNISVDSDGNVYPCCYDPFVTMNMGNLKEKSLREIWLGEKYMRLRGALMDGDFSEFPQCRNCGNWNLSMKISFEQMRGVFLGVEEYYEMMKYKALIKYPTAGFDYERYDKEAHELVKRAQGDQFDN